MSDSLKIWLRLAVAAVGVTVLALLSHHGSDETSSGRVIPPRTIAGCQPGVIMAGDGPADWRETSIDAGPVGIRNRPLRAMSRQPDGTLATKMGVLVEGHDNVTLAATSGMRGRVKLFYGNEARSFEEDSGFQRVRFRPCKDKERTVWPGGIAVKGNQRVRLKVTVADGEPFVIGLGMPKAMDPKATKEAKEAP
ncbi:MAG: hypothetical protein WBW44_11870 [Solirubrobacterales bacterium]